MKDFIRSHIIEPESYPTIEVIGKRINFFGATDDKLPI